MPKQDELKKYLRKPIVDTPDPFGCHKSYAEHHEKEVEESIPSVGISPEFLYQAKKYRSSDYDADMKFALEHTDAIKKILDKFRTEEVDDQWLPIALFCSTCGKDTVSSLEWKGGYKVYYACECGHSDEFDFRKKRLIKLKWRVDWPMRWHYEKVDFEPGGKDHSTVGGSYDTGKLISKEVWGFDAPEYVMYDFITVKGRGGKMSSSKGDVITLADALEVYEPDIVRYLFASTRPNAEFAISFDVDVVKVYEDFDTCERIAFGKQEASEKEKGKQRRIYELSCVGSVPKEMPIQPGFRHLTMMLQIFGGDMKKVIAHFAPKTADDKKRVQQRALCAKNWLDNYAPDDFKFSVQLKVPAGLLLSAGQKKALHLVAVKLCEKKWEAAELHNEIYEICKTAGIEPSAFFLAAYGVLINKQKGPRLAGFIIEVGQEKVAGLFEKV
jgi:lysyl-tRNA synthetase class 1